MLLAVAGLVMLAGWQARLLTLQPGIDLLSPSDPVAEREAARISRFGRGSRLMVAVHRSANDGGILTPQGLELLEATHLGLGAIDGIRLRSSLYNAPVLVSSPAAAAGEPLWDAESLADPRSLWRRVRSSDVQRNLLLSLDESIAPIYLELDPRFSEATIASRVQDLARSLESRNPGAGAVLVVGPALVENRLASLVLADLARLIPFSVLLMSLGLWLVFRSPVLTCIPLLHVLALTVLVLGGMATTGIPLDLVSVLAPVVLVPVGVADLLHLLVRLRAGGEAGRRTPRDALTDALARLQSPMATTTATTFLGFLAFLISPVPAIRLFGSTLAIGALLALLLTFTLDVALLTLFWHPEPAGPRRRSPRIGSWLASLRNPRGARWRAAAAALLLCLLALPAASTLPRLQIEDTWIQNFDPESRIVRDARRFESGFAGINRLSLVFSAEEASQRDRTFEAVARLTTSQVSVPGLRGVLSAPLLVRAQDPAAGWMWKPWAPPPPGERDLAFANWRERGLPLPPLESLRHAATETYQVHLMVYDQSLRELAQVRDRVLRQAREMAGPGVQVEVAGDLAVNIRMVYQAVRGQTDSLLVLCLVLTGSLLALTRSVRGTFVLLLPMAVSILATYSVLVWLDLPYGIAVSMFPTLVVGLAVDFSLHLRAALTRARDGSPTAWAEELRPTLSGILLNGGLWVAGFGILTVSVLPPNRYLGLLASLVIGLSAILTLLCLPLCKETVRRPRPVPASPDLDPPPAVSTEHRARAM